MPHIQIFPSESSEPLEFPVTLCNKCSAIVGDIQKHANWHLEKDKRTWGAN